MTEQNDKNANTPTTVPTSGPNGTSKTNEPKAEGTDPKQAPDAAKTTATTDKDAKKDSAK